QLEADAALAGDGRDDAHLARKAQRQVVGQACDSAHLGAGLARHLVSGDGRPWVNLDDLTRYVVVAQRLLELLGVLQDLAAVDLRRLRARRLEQGGGRQTKLTAALRFLGADRKSTRL